jgi:Protein of unknown function (DUF4245)
MSEPAPSGQRPDEQPATAGVPAADGPDGPGGATTGSTVTQVAESPEAPPAAPPVDRMARFSYRNMIWSLVPLVVICLALVGWSAFKYDGGDPVKTVETQSSIRAAAAVAGYPLLAPQGLDDRWRATSVRTNAGSAQPGDHVSLQIGWYTPTDEYASYVVSDDARDTALTGVLRTATDEGSVQVAGSTWERHRTTRGETALTRTDGSATMLVTGSSSEQELETLAGSLRPVTPTS